MTARPIGPWSHKVRVEDIPEAGVHLDLDPDEGVRAALAKLAGVVALPRLHAGFDIVRHGQTGMRVTGEVTANVVQNCVVTLEPMESSVAERVDTVFLPAKVVATDELVHDPEVDEPEPLVDGAADLGAVAAEFLLVGIDPYPRKPGVEFAAPEVKDAGVNPFAALAALKKD